MVELWLRLGNPTELYQVLYGRWVMPLVRGELRSAYELDEELLRRVQVVGDPAILVDAQYALGNTSFWMGNFLPAQEHLEGAIVAYDLERRGTPAFLHGEADPVVYCLCYLAWTLWLLGYPNQALKRGDEALALAQRLSHPLSSAVAGHFVAVVHQFRRESRAARETRSLRWQFQPRTG
jgi:predicted ATPase